MRPSRSICFKSLCEIKKSNKQLFSESTLYKVLCKENYYKKVICNRLAQSTVEIYQWVFPKVAALKHFTKGVMISSFHGAPRKKPSTKKKSGNAIFNKIAKITLSLSLRLSQSSYFKAICQKSNDQLLSWRFLYKGFYKQTTKLVEFFKGNCSKCC